MNNPYDTWSDCDFLYKGLLLQKAKDDTNELYKRKGVMKTEALSSRFEDLQIEDRKTVVNLVWDIE